MARLTHDGPEGPQEVDDPTAGDLSRAVRALDGEHCTLVSLEGEQGVLMCGGDASVGLVVTLQGREDCAVLVGASSADRPVTVVAGGQPGEYAADHVVDLQTAESAMQHFLEHGVLDPGREWAR